MRSNRAVLVCGAVGLLTGALAWAAPVRVLTIAQPAPPVSLDWTVSTRQLDLALIQNLQEGLLEVSPEGGLVGRLAESWSVEPDGFVYHFKLRPQVHWSDGVLLSAQHFVDAWQRLLDPALQAPYAYLLSQVQGALEYQQGKLKDFAQVGIRARSPSELEVRLKRPSVSWPWALSLGATAPIRRDLMARYGSAWTDPGKLVTVGPFRLERVESSGAGQHPTWVLRRNAQAAPARGDVDELRVVVAPEGARESLRSDLRLVAGRQATSLPSQPALRLHWLKAIRTKRLSFNTDRYPLTNVYVRQAIAHALSRPALAQELERRVGGGFEAASALVPSSLLKLEGGVPYDTKRAREQIASAGGANQLGPLTLMVPLFDSSRNENLTTARWLQATLASELGLAIKLELIEEPKRWSRLAKARAYSMILHDWTADYPDAANFYAVYSSRSGHHAQWSDPQFDRLIEAANENADPERRRKLYQDAETILTRQSVAMVPLVYARDAVWLSPRVGGYQAAYVTTAFRVREALVESKVDNYSQAR